MVVYKEVSTRKEAKRIATKLRKSGKYKKVVVEADPATFSRIGKKEGLTALCPSRVLVEPRKTTKWIKKEEK